MPDPLVKALEQTIREAAGTDFTVIGQRSVSGGCINQAILLEGQATRYFVKLNTADRLPMFEAELDGLMEIQASASIRVPSPLTCGRHAEQSFLILEALQFGSGTRDSWRRMGEQLAAMHHCTAAQYGWKRDNTIGATPQSNPRIDDWITFYREHRLRPQFELAAENGLHLDPTDPLMGRLEAFFADYIPVPSLLHGDLWSGNAGFDDRGEPVLFDPATYYGDRETDLAFTEFFGGFHPTFYQGYHAAWPLDPGYAARKDLYNLYHVLNHANLFGGGYAAQARSMIRTLLQLGSS